MTTVMISHIASALERFCVDIMTLQVIKHDFNAGTLITVISLLFGAAESSVNWKSTLTLKYTFLTLTITWITEVKLLLMYLNEMHIDHSLLSRDRDWQRYSPVKNIRLCKNMLIRAIRDMCARQNYLLSRNSLV